MPADNILLLRVGIDAGYDAHGPLLEDGTFEYIPIPEENETNESRTFSKIPGRHGGQLSRYVPMYSDANPHFDPEFESYTYGDPGRKRHQLKRLSEDDLLIFYSSLDPVDIDVRFRLFAIGYFTVEESHDLDELTPEERVQVIDAYPNNAHHKRKGLTPETPHRENYPVIVKGKPGESHLFDVAKPLGDSNNDVLPWVADIIGFDGDLTRAMVARVLAESKEVEIRRWLDEGSDVLVDESAQLRSYVMTSDTGFGPNVTGDVCTLATCKPKIRREANVGDWVIGTPGVEDNPERLPYLMRVEEILPLEEYYIDERFESKKPANDPEGDNIYYRDEEGILVQDEETGHHNDPGDIERDIGGENVLIGELFWYFDEESVTVPKSFRHDVIHKYKSDKRRFYSTTDRERLCDFVRWVSQRFDPGTQSKLSNVKD